MKILIVDDDLDTAKYLASILKQKNFVSEIVQNGHDALHSLRLMKFDLGVVDLDLPYINGKDLVQRIRKLNIDIPIIILTALSSVKEKVNLLSCGADDYITKPFDSREFLARVEAVIRRSLGLASSIIKFGSLTVDITNQIAYVEDTTIPLTKKEYLILELLITRKNSLVCKEVFLDHLYSNVCDQPNNKIVDVFTCKLRKKIMKTAKNQYNVPKIKTIWGRGYMMCMSNELDYDPEFTDLQEMKAVISAQMKGT